MDQKFSLDGKGLLNAILLNSCPDERTKALLKVFQKYGLSVPDSLALMMEMQAVLSQFPDQPKEETVEDK